MGVWIETILVDRGLNIVASHPAWVCGLKHFDVFQETAKKASHPAWVCGLKRNSRDIYALTEVTPCVGVWIETFQVKNFLTNSSHTLRGCVD